VLAPACTGRRGVTRETPARREVGLGSRCTVALSSGKCDGSAAGDFTDSANFVRIKKSASRFGNNMWRTGNTNPATGHSGFSELGRSATSAHQLTVLLSDYLQMSRSIFAGGFTLRFRILRSIGSRPNAIICLSLFAVLERHPGFLALSLTSLPRAPIRARGEIRATRDGIGGRGRAYFGDRRAHAGLDRHQRPSGGSSLPVATAFVFVVAMTTERAVYRRVP
jgi:hypothetical protein